MFNLQLIDDIGRVADWRFVGFRVVGGILVTRNDVVSIRAFDHVTFAFFEHLLRLDLILSVLTENLLELFVRVVTVLDVHGWG